jgi:hypothetical protein
MRDETLRGTDIAWPHCARYWFGARGGDAPDDSGGGTVARACRAARQGGETEIVSPVPAPAKTTPPPQGAPAKNPPDAVRRLNQSGVRLLGFFFFLFHQFQYWVMMRALLGQPMVLDWPRYPTCWTS